MSDSSVSVCLRIGHADLQLIDSAARVCGQSVDEFILGAARSAAEQVLLDQCFFRVAAQNFEELTLILDRPPRENERLCRLLSAPAPWGN